MSQQQALTLETVHMHFTKWRANKSGSSRIPESLWTLVQQLLGSSNYKRSIVARELGISTHQLRSRFPDFYSPLSLKSTLTNKPSDFTPKPSAFVKAPLNSLAITTATTLTIERGDGIKLSISAPSPEQFTSLVKTFME